MASAKSKTKKYNKQIERRPFISASSALWRAFDGWAKKMGYTSQPEAFRAAMIKVTDFDRESQAKSAAV